MRYVHSFLLVAASLTLLGCSSAPAYPPGRELLPEVVKAPAGAASPEEAFARLDRAHAERDHGAYFDLLAPDLRRQAMHMAVMAVIVRMSQLQLAEGDSGERTFLEVLEASGTSAGMRNRWQELHGSGEVEALVAFYDLLILEISDWRRGFVGCLRLLDLQAKELVRIGDADPGDPCAQFGSRGWTIQERKVVPPDHATLALTQKQGTETRELSFVEVEGKGWFLASETLRYFDTDGAAQAELERVSDRAKQD